jgi:hypothetical protein
MATERTWEHVYYDLDPAQIYDSAVNESIESYAVLKGAQILWAMKQSLLDTGNWQFVSCSYRTDATGSSANNYYYPTQSLTSYGQNAQPVDSGNGVKFATSSVDMWTTSSAILASVNGYDGIDLQKNQLHRLIYPAWSTNPYPTSDTLVSSSAGRSWVLLKESSGLLSQQGKDLYLALDYCYSYTPTAGTVITSSVISGVTSGGKYKQDATHFGRSINVAVFYGQPKFDTATSPNVRPYRDDEINFIGQNATSPTAVYSGWNTVMDFTNSDPSHVNCVYNTMGGFYITVSEEAKAKYILGIDKIEDNLAASMPSKQKVGKVVFLSYSSAVRGDMNNTSTAYVPDLFNTNRYGALDGGLAIDRSSWFRPLKYFKTVDDTSQPSNLVCLFPTYGNSRIGDTPIGFLGWNGKATSTTYDNTYVEYPISFLDVDIDTTKARYVGRFADIKIAPSAGINGTMARDPVSLEYDRFLLGGIWFPWNGFETINI